MKKTMLASLAVFALCGTQSCKTSSSMEAPVAAKKPKELTIHGHTRIDNYYWLRERENPEVISYLEAENAYRERVMKDTEQLQKDLFEEIVGRIKQDDESVPYKENGYYYYTRYAEGKEYPIFCRKKESLEAAEEILANVNELARGHEYFQVGGLSVSPDNRYMAIGIDTVSRRKYTIYIKDLETGMMLDDEIKLTTGGAAWASDSRNLFYTQKDDETLRSKAIYRHVMGTPSAEDVLVFDESDETFSTFVYKSKSKEYMIIGSTSTLTSEYRFLPADDPTGEFQIIQPRTRGLEYSISHYGDNFYIITNLDATNFRLMKTPLDQTGKEHWTEVIAHREDVFLEGIEIFQDYLVVEERKEGLSHLRVIPWTGGKSITSTWEKKCTVHGSRSIPSLTAMY
jgi:oligopeptidase B